MNKNYCIYIFIFSFIILNMFLVIACLKTNSNQEDYFRLHIVANSNSIDDQITKLKISKKITNYISNLNMENINKENTKEIIQNNIGNILEIANNELAKENTNYFAIAKIGKIAYGEKHSDKIDMKKGTYDSMQIVLGNGNGENFWTLIFPYAYNPNYELGKDELYDENEEIQIQSGIIETLKKVVKHIS